MSIVVIWSHRHPEKNSYIAGLYRTMKVPPVLVKIYNTSGEVRQLATWFIMVQAVFMPQNAFLHAAYFTLRSGGKTIVTFILVKKGVWMQNVVSAQ